LHYQIDLVYLRALEYSLELFISLLRHAVRIEGDFLPPLAEDEKEGNAKETSENTCEVSTAAVSFRKNIAYDRYARLSDLMLSIWRHVANHCFELLSISNEMKLIRVIVWL
jgi:hypothetical protein